MDYQIVIELIVTIIVIIVQFYFFLKTKSKIFGIQNIFPRQNLQEENIILFDNGEEEVEIIDIEDNKHSEGFTDIVNSINKYLVKNKGAVDFSIIKSIVERNIEARDEDVSSSISLPLYIGLLGTFVGIIAGLVKIAFFGGVIQKNIDAFIGGVFIAMIASFLGLLLTIINNSGNYKKAKRINDYRKNDFFNFLQIELLPHLGNSIYDVFDKFKTNIAEFNSKFSNSINLFDEKFSDNIQDLKRSVETISENVDPIIENIQVQRDFLRELKGRGYDKIVRANLETFDIMEKAVPNFIEFVDKQKNLNVTIEKLLQIVSVIDSMMNRVAKFENSLNALGDRIDSADYMGSDLVKKVNAKLEELDRQFELLKQHSQFSKGTIEHHFSQQVSQIEILSARILADLQRALNFDIESNPLTKLQLLENIKNQMDELLKRPNSVGEISKISDSVSNAKNDIRDIKELAVLKLTEKKGKKGKSSIPSANNEEEPIEIKRPSIWRRLNPFKRNRKKGG